MSTVIIHFILLESISSIFDANSEYHEQIKKFKYLFTSPDNQAQSHGTKNIP